MTRATRPSTDDDPPRRTGLASVAAALLAAPPPSPPARDASSDAAGTADADDSLASLITTRARAYLARFARGLTPGRLIGQLTVTASDRLRDRTRDRRSTSSGACRTRTRPPDPLGGRSATADDRGGAPAHPARDAERGDEV